MANRPLPSGKLISALVGEAPAVARTARTAGSCCWRSINPAFCQGSQVATHGLNRNANGVGKAAGVVLARARAAGKAQRSRVLAGAEALMGSQVRPLTMAPDCLGMSAVLKVTMGMSR